MSDLFSLWLASICAVGVVDWRIAETPSWQYPAGRWEAKVEFQNGRCQWMLVHPDVLPCEVERCS